MCLSFALEPCEETRAQLVLFQEKLRARSVSGHFFAPEALRLTLVSLGECDERRLTCAEQAMGAVQFEPFSLTIAGGGYLDKRRPNPVFCELRKDDGYTKLRQLQSDLLLNLSAKGIKLEPGKFWPHISLGQEVVWRNTGGFSSFADIQFPVMEEWADELVLINQERIHGGLMDVPLCRKKAVTR